MRLRFARLVFVGSVIVDIGVSVDVLPALGADTLARRGQVGVGGAFNVLSAARRQGLRGAYVGHAGPGPLGRLVLSALQEEDIETVFPPTPTGDTGFCVVVVDAQGERTMITTVGVEGHLSAADLAHVRPGAEDIVAISGYDLVYPHGANIAEWLERLPTGVEIVFDPGPLVREISDDLLTVALRRSAWLSLNAHEASELAGGSPRGVARMAECLLRTHPNLRGVVVREGAAGCVLSAGEGTERVPAFSAEVLDTTGAGDTHVGAFAAALARGESARAACTWGNAAASVAVARPGAATAPRRHEIEQLVGQRLKDA